MKNNQVAIDLLRDVLTGRVEAEFFKEEIARTLSTKEFCHKLDSVFGNTEFESRWSGASSSSISIFAFGLSRMRLKVYWRYCGYRGPYRDIGFIEYEKELEPQQEKFTAILGLFDLDEEQIARVFGIESDHPLDEPFA